MGNGNGNGNGRAARARVDGRPAFSMIELIVSIGIIMILIGLMLPSLSATRKQAERTRNLSAIRADLQFLTKYTSDYKERFPVGWSTPISAAKLWFRPLIASGIIDSYTDLGIVDDTQQLPLVALTLTALEDQTAFQPGANRDIYEEPIAGQQSGLIQFSSEKALLWQYESREPGLPSPEWCCGPIAPVVAFGFADGSAFTATYKQFRVEPEPLMYLQVGVPVQSTWFGLAGRDIFDR